ncbi:thiamine ABC transporter substrate-binding protein [Luteipulveratus halotolerans]|uniref:ABC transporter substrate-binding protein n=1 Tax=Luteipulveratus halotolerans TaxID=1631356 RepID=A0A0L6CKZ5_9MICO|nr:thiamine ABC transporter substrate-binding protein [Luteipulveratus halotolerans]KNX38446.1 ABC transporter substrate-binding protein [Luteipulveratus halotolerans]
MRRTTTTLAAVCAAAITMTGCSLSNGDDQTPASDTAQSAAESGAGASTTSAGAASTPANKTVTLITHDSFAAPKPLLAQFTKETGYTVKVLPSGDAGQVANKLVLTKGSPVGDAVFGIDNTFASRVVDEGVLQTYTPKAPAKGSDQYALKDGKGQLTPVDYGHTCFNVDTTWFAKKGLAEPKTFDDLTKPAYKNLMVAPGAPTSSPGLAMLLATIGAKGENGWQAYWKALTANGLKLTSGWEDAYNVDFTQGEGKGSRPIVWSYDTSPAFTVAGGKSTTKALLDTCFRQVEYSGVLKGAKNPDGAKALVDWMQGKAFQEALPPNMYVFPVASDAAIPADWQKFAQRPTKPFAVDPATIAAKRQTWLTQWQDITSK